MLFGVCAALRLHVTALWVVKFSPIYNIISSPRLQKVKYLSKSFGDNFGTRMEGFGLSYVWGE